MLLALGSDDYLTKPSPGTSRRWLSKRVPSRGRSRCPPGANMAFFSVRKIPERELSRPPSRTTRDHRRSRWSRRTQARASRSLDLILLDIQCRILTDRRVPQPPGSGLVCHPARAPRCCKVPHQGADFSAFVQTISPPARSAVLDFSGHPPPTLAPPPEVRPAGDR